MRFTNESLPLTASEFTILRDLIRERTGISFENDKRDILADKLSARAVEKGFDSFIDYYYLLKYGPGAETEWPFVMDALSVPETYFWREMDAVRALVDVLVPRHFAGNAAGPMRIWSAACATGEEPLTIAMALNEAGWLDRVPVQIRASDGSPAAVAKARQGVYRERLFRNLAPALRAKYFTTVDGGWRVAPKLQDQVVWENVNLLSAEEVSRQLPAAVVFCRNVFIYFSADAIVRTVRQFAEGMPRGSCLFVGVSESLLQHTADFELQELEGTFAYIRH